MVKKVIKNLLIATCLTVANVVSAENLILLGVDGFQDKVEFTQIQNFVVINSDSISTFTANMKDGTKKENIRLFTTKEMQMAKTVDKTAIADSISIFPNPVSDKLRIYGAGESPKVYIMNMNGEIVIESKGSEVIVSSLSEGIYLVKVGGLFAKFLKK